MREYFCAYHSMLDATRKLSDAEVGRLFRGLLHYSATGEQPINLQGREEIVFDIFSQQIDRDVEKYNAACERNKRNVTSRYQSLPVATSRNESKQEEEKEKEKDKEEDKDKEKDKGGSNARARTRFTAPTVNEVDDYAQGMGYTGFSAQRFVDYYASKGWVVGKSPMRDWKAAVRGWASRDRGDGRTQVDRRPQENPALNYAQRGQTHDVIVMDLDKWE